MPPLVPLAGGEGGPLAHPESLPLRAGESVQAWGRTLVVAPHPDDESLGCGGAIALLCQAAMCLHVLFVSDGTGSHPHSQKYPAPALRALRETEAREALLRLGVSSPAPVFLRLPDGAVPGEQTQGFTEAVTLCRREIERVQPQTLLLPWRRDPHPDHRATSQIVRAALLAHPHAVGVLEYPIWAWERAAPGDLPRADEVQGFRLDIAPVAEAKRHAIDAHQSQVTHLIDDDPQGFWLSPEVLAHFARPWEVYLEARDL